MIDFIHYQLLFKTKISEVFAPNREVILLEVLRNYRFAIGGDKNEKM